MTPGDGLLHPACVVAVAVLVLNDHWFKHAFHGPITGKLSDFAGLVFFPLFLQAAWEVGTTRARFEPRREVLVLAALASALVLGAINVCGPAGDLYQWGLGALQWPAYAAKAFISGEALPAIRWVSLDRDPTDLIALPAALVAVRIGWHRCQPLDTIPDRPRPRPAIVPL